MVARTQSLVLYVCGTICAALVLLPTLIYATGTDADKQCTPFYSECQCMMKPNPDKRQGQPKCIQGENKNKCICTDKTNKFTTVGSCVSDGVCKGTTAGNLDGKQTGLTDPKQWGAYSASNNINIGDFGSFGSGGEFTSGGFDGGDMGGNSALDADAGESWTPEQTDPPPQHVNTDPNSASRGLDLLSSEPVSDQKPDLTGGNATANDVFSQTPLSQQTGQLSEGSFGGEQNGVGSGETVNASEHTFGNSEAGAEGSIEAQSSCSGWLCSASETMSKYDPFNNQAASHEAANQQSSEPLRAESNGRVDPAKLYNAAYDAYEKALEKNGGSWPKATLNAFERIGVDDPTDPDQLAKATVMLAKTESNFDPKLISKGDAAVGLDSRGLFQLNNQGGDARYGIAPGDALNPQKSVEAVVKIAEQGQLSNYFGPIKRGGESVLANDGWYEANVAPRVESPSAWDNIPKTASYTTSSELTNNFGMYNTGLGSSEYASLADPYQPTSRFDGADTLPSSNQPIANEMASLPPVSSQSTFNFIGSEPTGGLSGGYTGPGFANELAFVGQTPGAQGFSYAPSQGVFDTASGYMGAGDSSPTASMYDVAQGVVPSGQFSADTQAFETRWENAGGQYEVGQSNLSSYDTASQYMQSQSQQAVPSVPSSEIDIPAEPGYSSPPASVPGIDLPAEPGYALPSTPAPGLDIQTETALTESNDVVHSGAPVGKVEQADLQPVQQSFTGRVTGALGDAWTNVREWWTGGDIAENAPVTPVENGALADISPATQDGQGGIGSDIARAPNQEIDDVVSGGVRTSGVERGADLSAPAPGLEIPTETALTPKPAPGMEIQTETHNSNLDIFNLGTETYNSNLGVLSLGVETHASIESGLAQSLGIIDPVTELPTGEQMTAQIAAEAERQNVIPSGVAISDLPPGQYSLGAEGDSLTRDTNGDITYTDRNGAETHIAGNTVGSMTASEFERQVIQGQVPTMSDADVEARIPSPDAAQLDAMFAPGAGEKLTEQIAYQDAMERFKDDTPPPPQRSFGERFMDALPGTIENIKGWAGAAADWFKNSLEGRGLAEVTTESPEVAARGALTSGGSEPTPWPPTEASAQPPVDPSTPPATTPPTAPPATQPPATTPSATPPATTPPATTPPAAPPPATPPPATSPPATPPPGNPQTSGRPSGSGSGSSGILSSLGQMLGQMLGKLLGNNQQQQSTQTPQQTATTTTTTTTTPAIPAIASLLADPARTTTGNSVRLVWASVGTIGCSVKDGAGMQVSSGSADGFVRTEALATSTTFTLTCATSIGGSVSASTTVIVSPAATTTTATSTATTTTQ